MTKRASPHGFPPSLMRGLHALAPPRCRLAAIYLIAACASRPEGFLYNRKVQSIFLLYKKGEPDISSVSPVQWLFCKVFPHLKPHSVLLRHSTEKGWKHIAILLSFAFYPYQTISTTISSLLSLFIFILCAYPKGTWNARHKNNAVSKRQSLIKLIHDVKTVMFCFHH